MRGKPPSFQRRGFPPQKFLKKVPPQKLLKSDIALSLRTRKGRAQAQGKMFAKRLGICYNTAMDSEKAAQMNPLTLAFVGDGVYNLYVRTYALEHMDVKASRMNAFCKEYVRATAQAKAYRAIEPELTEAELAVAKRARNAHPRNKAKNASGADYMHATALEAVIGYLYAGRQTERLGYIQRRAMEESV